NGNMYAYDIIAVHSGVYFTGEDSLHGNELWESNGTPEGTLLIKDINPGINSSSCNYLTYNQNGTVFFAANDGQSGLELWKSNGSSAGTSIISQKLIPYDLYKQNYLVVNNYMYLSGTVNGEYGLVKTDGTEAGTVLVKRMAYSYIQQITSGSNLVYFVAKN